MKKKFYIQENIGKARYVLNLHDGKTTHRDGSPFYDVQILSTKKALKAAKKRLLLENYVEGD